MTNPYKYHTVSLRNKTYSKLKNLSNVVVKGEELSSAKTVEKLINDKHNRLEKKLNEKVSNSDDRQTGGIANAQEPPKA